MNGIKIKETKDTKPFNGMPLCYRVSITPNVSSLKYPLIIERKFFRAGFRDGEQFGKFFFVEHENGVEYASFISKKVKDKDYLDRKEKELIEEYIEKCEKSVILVENNLRKTTYNLKIKKEGYLKIIDELSNLDRRKKIKKVLSKLKK